MDTWPNRSRIAILLLGLVILACPSCGQSRQVEVEKTPAQDAAAIEDDRKNERAAKSAVISKILQDLATRHQASGRDWLDKVLASSGIENIYTLDVQDALKSINGRPAIVVCVVFDVYEEGESFRILCHPAPQPSHLMTDTFPPVAFRLDATENIARKIVQATRSQTATLQYCAFAVQPTRWKLHYEREHTARGEYIDVGEGERHEGRLAEAEIEEGDLLPTFEISGRCLEFVRLEHYDSYEE